MKKIILTLSIILSGLFSFSQTIKFRYTGRYNPAMNKEKAVNSIYLNEIMPDFMRVVFMQREDFEVLTGLCKMVDYPAQENYIMPQDCYTKAIDILSSEIMLRGNTGKPSVTNNGHMLSEEQKKWIASLDFGTDIVIKIKFRFKPELSVTKNPEEKAKEAEYMVTLIPDKEAEFPGGLSKMSNYYTENVISKLNGKTDARNFSNAVVVFTVNEEGKIINSKISRSSSDDKLDKLLLEVTEKMPVWSPAKNIKGTPVKQTIVIPFGGDGGC